MHPPQRAWSEDADPTFTSDPPDPPTAWEARPPLAESAAPSREMPTRPDLSPLRPWSPAVMRVRRLATDVMPVRRLSTDVMPIVRPHFPNPDPTTPPLDAAPPAERATLLDARPAFPAQAALGSGLAVTPAIPGPTALRISQL